MKLTLQNPLSSVGDPFFTVVSWFSYVKNVSKSHITVICTSTYLEPTAFFMITPSLRALIVAVRMYLIAILSHTWLAICDIFDRLNCPSTPGSSCQLGRKGSCLLVRTLIYLVTDPTTQSGTINDGTPSYNSVLIIRSLRCHLSSKYDWLRFQKLH